MSDDDILTLAETKEQQSTPSITKFFKAIPKTTPGTKLAPAPNSCTVIPTSHNEVELITAVQCSEVNKESRLTDKEETKVDASIVEGERDGIVESKEDTSKVDKREGKTKNIKKKKKGRQPKQSVASSVVPCNANNEVELVYVSYEAFLENGKLSGKSKTNELSRGADTNVKTKLVKSNVKSTKIDKKDQPTPSPSDVKRVESKDLSSSNFRGGITGYFKSNQTKPAKNLVCSSPSKGGLTTGKRRRRKLSTSLSTKPKDEFVVRKSPRSSRQLRSSTDSESSKFEKCKTVKKLRSKRRTSPRPSVLSETEVLRRSPRLRSSSKPLLKDSRKLHRTRNSSGTLAEVAPNGKGPLSSSYKVAFISTRKSHTGIKIRLTRLLNQNEKPAVAVQKARRLLKRAKFESAVGRKPTSVIQSSGRTKRDKVLGTLRTKNVKVTKGGELAPIFQQRRSKKKAPVLDKAVVEQRQRFLMSGIPEKLKKQIERTEACVPSEFFFPAIGHIQQKDVQIGEASMWNLQWPSSLEKLNCSECDVPSNVHGPLVYGTLTNCKPGLGATYNTTLPNDSKECLVHPTLTSGDVLRVLSEIKQRYGALGDIDDIYQSYVGKRCAAIVLDDDSDDSFAQQQSKPVDLCDVDEKRLVPKRKRLTTSCVLLDGEESLDDAKKRHKTTERKKFVNKASAKANTKSFRSHQHATSPSKTEKESGIAVSESSTTNDSTASLCHKKSTALWTSVYKPVRSQDVIGNKSPVQQLKSWLTRWKTSTISAEQKEKKYPEKCRRKSNGIADSDSDFDAESDSEGNYSDLCNTVLLVGPSGCGKSTTVYAVASELGYKVLEVNSTSKRSGKQVLAQLQEATQSHQVGERRCGGGSSPSSKNAVLTSFFRGSKKPLLQESGIKNDSDDSNEVQLIHASSQDQGTVSLILFQDVDVVFSEDDGFWSAVNSFMSTAKRPIVLTSSDLKFSDRGRVKENYQEIILRTPDIQLQCLHLQLLCLAEQALLNADDCLDVINRCNGNYRQTLLCLQFWNDSWMSKKDEAGTLKVFPFGSNDLFPLECFVERELQTIIDRNNIITEADNASCSDLKENAEICLATLDSLSSFMDNRRDIPFRAQHVVGSSAEILPGFEDDEDRGSDIDHISDNAAATDIWSNLKLLNDGCLKSSLNKQVSAYKTNMDDLEGQFTKLNTDEFLTRQDDVQSVIRSLPVMSQINTRACHLDYLPFVRAVGRSEVDRRLTGVKRGRRFTNYLCSTILFLDESVVDNLLTAFPC